MKIRNGFVSNSSSSNFVIAFKPDKEYADMEVLPRLLLFPYCTDTDLIEIAQEHVEKLQAEIASYEGFPPSAVKYTYDYVQNGTRVSVAYTYGEALEAATKRLKDATVFLEQLEAADAAGLIVQEVEIAHSGMHREFLEIIDKWKRQWRISILKKEEV